MRRRSIAFVSTLFALFGCISQEETLEHKCVRLRDHVVQLRLHGLPDADQDAHRRALSESLGDAFVDQCRTLTTSQLKCAFDADDVVDVTACSDRR